MSGELLTGRAPRDRDSVKVLIIGGGVGGLCLAQGLARRAVDVEVYERAEHPDAGGDRYRLHISPAGSRALHACLPSAAWQRFLDGAGQSGGGFGFLTERLETLVVVEDEIMYPPSADPAQRQYPVDRRELRAALLTGLGDRVRFGRRFTHYETTPAGEVRAMFDDGSDAIGSVLVGADGVSSAVRRQLLPDAQHEDAHAEGVGLKLPLDDRARGWLPGRLAAGMNVITAPGPMFLFTSVYERNHSQPADHRDDYLLCAFVARRSVLADASKTPGGELQRSILRIMKDWDPRLRRVIKECEPASVDRYSFSSAKRPSAWTPSRVTVLGDAIHHMSPTGGNGANMALRDAHLLTLKLTEAARGETPLVSAIGSYEQDMLDYAFAAVRRAADTLNLGLIANPIALAAVEHGSASATPPARSGCSASRATGPKTHRPARGNKPPGRSDCRRQNGSAQQQARRAPPFRRKRAPAQGPRSLWGRTMASASP